MDQGCISSIFSPVEEVKIFILEWIKVYLLLLYVAHLTFVHSRAASLHPHCEKAALQGVYSPRVYMKTGCLIAAAFS